jgi:hypothetical protein
MAASKNSKILAVIALILLIGALVAPFILEEATGKITQMILVAIAAIIGFVIFGNKKNYQA